MFLWANIRDYVVPSLIGATSYIKKPTINANNFGFNPGII